jgi:hypothetical protein
MGWLSRLKEWATRNPVEQVDDEQLGPLILDDIFPCDCWVARVTARGREIRFEIGGEYEPDPKLINRARDIFGSFDRFDADVTAFLATEAARPEWAPFADEIRALAIEAICLFFRPYRPAAGMIFFAGPDADRCWKCDLIGRTPVGLIRPWG